MKISLLCSLGLFVTACGQASGPAITDLMPGPIQCGTCLVEERSGTFHASLGDLTIAGDPVLLIAVDDHGLAEALDLQAVDLREPLALPHAAGHRLVDVRISVDSAHRSESVTLPIVSR